MISEDHVTLKTSNDDENTDLITAINSILKYIHIEKFFFFIVFHNITVCLTKEM